jgi:hypothetical protein
MEKYGVFILLIILVPIIIYMIGRIFGLGVGKSLLNTFKKEKKG